MGRVDSERDVSQQQVPDSGQERPKFPTELSQMGRDCRKPQAGHMPQERQARDDASPSENSKQTNGTLSSGSITFFRPDKFSPDVFRDK